MFDLISSFKNAGILLYEMLYGRTPFRGKNRQKTFSNILHKELTFPSSIPVRQHVQSDHFHLFFSLLVVDYILSYIVHIILCINTKKHLNFIEIAATNIINIIFFCINQLLVNILQLLVNILSCCPYWLIPLLATFAVYI